MLYMYVCVAAGEITDSCVLPDWGGILIVSPSTTMESPPMSTSPEPGADMRLLQPALLQGALEVRSKYVFELSRICRPICGCIHRKPLQGLSPCPGSPLLQGALENMFVQ